MDSNSMFLETFAWAHRSPNCLENEDWEMISCFMNGDGSPLSIIHDLKDKGNVLFKQNCFEVDGSCYDRACKILSFIVVSLENYDAKSCSDLAVSLSLNLTACALKVQEHEMARDICSMILSYFPENIKALFRRALSFMKCDMFLEAHEDLEKALKIEPQILRIRTFLGNIMWSRIVLPLILMVKGVWMTRVK
ncbi:hypothetical protein RND81_11G007100 [Saponaria officinalis]|uniref:Uncharacterized protein n=1 Tax=Saponaria officinalis TaxID=3572 RepID=A0AAW1HGV7_SAPOF